MPGRSLYDVVGVDVGASAQEIRAAYRRAARDAHPDLGGSDAAFRRVSAAYDVLRDPARRARYDRWLAAQAAGAGRGGAAQGGAGRGGEAQGGAAQGGAAQRGAAQGGAAQAAGAARATGRVPGQPAAASWAARPGSSSSGPAGTGGRRAGADTTRLQRNYLVTMTTCLLLFVLSGAVVRAYSVPAAVAMAVVAMVLLPLAALMANRRAR